MIFFFNVLQQEQHFLEPLISQIQLNSVLLAKHNQRWLKRDSGNMQVIVNIVLIRLLQFSTKLKKEPQNGRRLKEALLKQANQIFLKVQEWV